jgi:hypothetical protein
LGVVVHACSSSTPAAEAEVLQVAGQPGLHCENLSQKNKEKKRKLNNFVPVILLLLFTF